MGCDGGNDDQGESLTGPERPALTVEADPHGNVIIFGLRRRKAMAKALDKNQKKAYNAAFCERTTAARLGTGMSIAEMARALGVNKDTYAKTEKRGPLPHYLIERFCRLANVDLHYLVTGALDSGKRSNGSAKRGKSVHKEPSQSASR